MKTKEKPMLTKSRLKSERGWTDKLIESFLPNPDDERRNPFYRNAPPMLLFSIERVEEIEQTDEFKKALSDSEKRKVGAKKAIETKKKQLQDWLNKVVIDFPIVSKDEIIENACFNYNEIQFQRDCEGLKSSDINATPNSEPKFLDRICVNYLRHCLTQYEDYLDKMYGRVGFSDGYDEIRRKIFSKISEVYPWLAEECKRQQEGITNF